MKKLCLCLFFSLIATNFSFAQEDSLLVRKNFFDAWQKAMQLIYAPEGCVFSLKAANQINDSDPDTMFVVKQADKVVALGKLFSFYMDNKTTIFLDNSDKMMMHFVGEKKKQANRILPDSLLNFINENTHISRSNFSENEVCYKVISPIEADYEICFDLKNNTLTKFFTYYEEENYSPNIYLYYNFHTFAAVKHEAYLRPSYFILKEKKHFVPSEKFKTYTLQTILN